MTHGKRQRIRLSLALCTLMASCFHASSGRPPVAELNLSETTSGPHGKAPFAVVAAGPRGEITLDHDPGVTVVFNRPMRAIDAPNDERLPAVQVSTGEGKVVEGQMRWIGTRGLVFKPARPLPGATRYRLTVPSGTKAVDGSTLASDFTLEFSTPPPRLVTTVPETRPLRPTESIFLAFSQPIDPATLMGSLELFAQVSPSEPARKVPVAIRHAAPDWDAHSVRRDVEANYKQVRSKPDASGKWLEVTPTQALPLDASLELRINKGLTSNDGPLPTDAPVSVSLRSFGPLRLINLNCARQNLGRCQAHRDFEAALSNPVHTDEFRKYLTITGPKRPAKPNTGAAKPKHGMATTHALALDPEYGDRFRVTLRAGMTDVFGHKLAKDVSVELQVEEPYTKPNGQPVVVAQSENTEQPAYESGGDESQASDAGLPKRPRLRYDLELGITGHILEATASAPKPPTQKLPVSAINVPTYGLHTDALPEWSTIRWLNGQRDSFAYRPFSWITPQAPKNTRAVQQLEVKQLLRGANTGAAVVSLIGLGQLDSQDTLINVTDLGISARMSRFGSLVWVTRLSTGEPVRDATVSAYNGAGDVVCSGSSDANGLVSFSAKQLGPITKHGAIDSSLVLVARSNEDFSYQRLQPARTTTSMGAVDYAQKGRWAGLVFTDRAVYRPGESVKAGGFFRQTSEKGFILRQDQAYQYQIWDSRNEMVAVGESKLDAFGALAATIALSKSAALGRANLTVRFGHQHGEQFSVPLDILSYKPAEFKVTVQPQATDMVHRQTASFNVSAEYLFGTPVSEAKVQQYVTRNEVEFAPPNSSGYVTDDQAYLSDLRYVSQRGSAYSQHTRTLDSKGQAVVQVALDAKEQSKTESLTLEAEVQDLSAQTQAGRVSILVHPAQYYLGLKQPKKRFLAVGAELPIEAIALTPKGARVTTAAISIQLWRRNWTSALEDRPSDALHHQTHVRDEKQAECRLDLAKPVQDCHIVLKEPGYYVLRGSSQDALGNVVHSSFGIYALSGRADEFAAPVGFRTEGHRELKLELDQKKYQPGDTAKILVKNPFKLATALVTVERGGVFERSVTTLRGPMPVVEVPIREDYFPNAFVSIHLLRGRVAKIPAPGHADVGAPDYRIGYAELVVDPESRRLKISIASGKSEYRPGDPVQANVTLARADGKPSSGVVTFYVVDEGVLRLTGYKTPDPLPAFSGRRELGVFPVESRDHLARILAYRDGERISPLGFEILNPGNDKGDEGGGGDMVPGKLRSDFRTTVYFEAGRAVGADGKSRFDFKLPDNLTSYRLMAVAAGAEDRFGFGESTIMANRPLMARPALPRQLRAGDTLQAGLVVSSKGAITQPVDVTLKVKGAVLKDSPTRRVTLSPSGQAEARFLVQAEREGQAEFEWSVRSGNHSDRVLVTRKIEQPVRWLSASTYGSTDKTISIKTGRLEGMRDDRGELNVSLSNSALVGLKSVFDELETYPYGCTEQLTSRALPLLMATKLAEMQHVRLTAKNSDTLDSILGEIAKRQRYDGSLGYFDDDTQSSPWLSAYGLLALEVASRSGYFVPKRVRDNLASFLTRSLDEALSRQPGSSTQEDGNAHEPSNDDPVSDEQATSTPPTETAADLGFGNRQLGPREQRRKTLAQASFVADILARIGSLDQSRLRRLISMRSEMALSSQIQLLHAMATLRLPLRDLNQGLAIIQPRVTVGPAEARVETEDAALSELLESKARSTAMLLDAVLEMDAQHPLAPKLARGLLAMRTGASYRSTQEDAWALLALEKYRANERLPEKRLEIEVSWGDEFVGSHDLGGGIPRTDASQVPAKKLLQNPTSLLTLALKDEGQVNYSVDLKLAKDGASKIPLDQGLSLEKLVRALEPNELKEAAKVIPERSSSEATLGNLVLVDLLLESAESRDWIVIDDPMPAGFEPVEFGFDTTAQALAMAERTDTQPKTPTSSVPYYGNRTRLAQVHREMHDDRVHYFIAHVGPGIYHLRYLARATAAGRFVMPPTRASCMYDPEVFGQTKATLFDITTAK